VAIKHNIKISFVEFCYVGLNTVHIVN